MATNKKTKPLTKDEIMWIDKVNKVLSECPSERLSSFTIGDNQISLYDNRFDKKIIEIQENGQSDYCTAVQNLGCDLGSIDFPFPVHSTAG